MFHFQAFSVVFQKAIGKADPAGDVKQRVDNLIECITYSVFQYTTRGLFECDKLIFTAQMGFQVRLLDRRFHFPFIPVCNFMIKGLERT